MSAPSAARARAMDLPMPRLAPVTRAMWFCRVGTWDSPKKILGQAKGRFTGYPEKIRALKLEGCGTRP